MEKRTLILLLQILFVYCQRSNKSPVPYNDTMSHDYKFTNPGFARDRSSTKIKEIEKPKMPENWRDRFKKPYNPAWMDYCDPYHCNDYHKLVCGLNRANMVFKWFQSICHLILNNQCSVYRGALNFDVVEDKFCSIYVMFLRQGCPTSCEDEEFEPKCGINAIDGRLVLFENQCSLDAANCKSGLVQEYDEVRMDICEYQLRYGGE